MGGTVGAIFGPLLVSPSSRLALSLGLPELAGVFIVSLVIYLLSYLISQWGLRPEPMLLSKEIDARYEKQDPTNGNARPLSELLRVPGIIVAISVATSFPVCDGDDHGNHFLIHEASWTIAG
jgi:hypothetical protein